MHDWREKSLSLKKVGQVLRSTKRVNKSGCLFSLQITCNPLRQEQPPQRTWDVNNGLFIIESKSSEASD